MSTNKQWITHTINLAEENDSILGQFVINIILQVDKSRIATDIRTSFPYLVEKDRKIIDHIILNGLKRYKQDNESLQAVGQLQLIEQFIKYIQPVILAAYINDPEIEIETIAVDLYLETYQKQTIYKHHP